MCVTRVESDERTVSPAFTLIALCTFNIYISVCRIFVRQTVRCMCLCPGGDVQCDCSHGMGCVYSTYPRGISNTTEGLDRLTPRSDLCLVPSWAPQAPLLPASVCVCPLGKILSGMLCEKVVGEIFMLDISARQNREPSRGV